MAIDPDDIIAEQEQPLSNLEEETVDRLEARIDRFLRLNYYPDGYANYLMPESVSDAVARALAKRYRDKWAIQIHDADDRYPVVHQTRRTRGRHCAPGGTPRVLIRVVAILETMWDWRLMTSGAGYTQAPNFFRINPQNHSGRRLYKLVGPDAKLLVTNACRELVSGPEKHGKGDPAWLAGNLGLIEDRTSIQVLLVCGKVAQQTFKLCNYKLKLPDARVIEMPHPAARMWTQEMIKEISKRIRGEGERK